jgi:hypothetical protein
MHGANMKITVGEFKLVTRLLFSRKSFKMPLMVSLECMKNTGILFSEAT